MTDLTYVDHIAIESTDIKKSIQWYQNEFNCIVKYQDDTWAMLKFDNISLALVSPGGHPPHIAVIDEDIVKEPNSKIHRDGIRYLYETDPDSNFIEKIDKKS